MHIAEFLMADDETLLSEVATLRRRADALDRQAARNPSIRRGKYSPQSTMRKEASAIEQLLKARVASRPLFNGTHEITFRITGSVPNSKMPKSHTLFQIEEV